MNETIIEKFLKVSPNPVTIENTTKIIYQMEKCICKIKYRTKKGTGFFCNIPFREKYIPCLITNYHIIDDIYINENLSINITINDDKEAKILSIDNTRIKYTNKNYDISIIEIKAKDNINDFLYLDDNLLKENSKIFYEGESIYNIHYPKGEKSCVSYGILKEIKNYDILHLCCTDYGSSGSPILNLSNNKIIGIHKESSKKYNFNIGTFLKYPINDFINKIKLTNLKKVNYNYNNSRNKKKALIDNYNIENYNKGILSKSNEYVHNKFSSIELMNKYHKDITGFDFFEISNNKKIEKSLNNFSLNKVNCNIQNNFNNIFEKRREYTKDEIKLFLKKVKNEVDKDTFRIFINNIKLLASFKVKNKIKIIENVKKIFGEKHKEFFNEFQEILNPNLFL